MIIDQNASSLPETFLRSWPGRFRHAQLVRRLHGNELHDDPARCLLEGISSARSVDEVLEEFADRGEFQLAELLLAESDAVSPRVRARLGDLEPRRAERMSELVNRLQTLTDEASAAGIPLEVNLTDLEGLTRVSWPAAEDVLAEHRNGIVQQISTLRADLLAQNHSSGRNPRLCATVDSLIAAGRLTLARRILDDESSDLAVPEAEPALLAWRWSEPAAEVLSWHVDPTRPKPPEFSAWRAVNDTAQDLVEAAEALGGGGQEAATDFVVALNRFLDRDAPEPTVHEISGGWMSTVALFRHAPLTSFRATAGVDLLILPPGVQNTPALPGVDNYLAVGADLQAGGGFRNGAAVLTMPDLLRLVTLPAGRAVGLARIVGRQWPLSALGVGTPAGLARLLAEDPDHSWHLLGWLCSLAGIGGSATAEDLQYQSGDDAPVLHTLLTNFVDAAPKTADRGVAEAVSASPFREGLHVGVEGVVLRDCPDPASRAAFWAALLAAAPGTSLSLDALVIAAVLNTNGDEADWESILAAGFGRLREQWFVDQVDENDVSIRPIGVLVGLRSRAERRLAECALELKARTVERLGKAPVIPRSWSVHRYALIESWASYQQVLQSEADPIAGMNLTGDTGALIEAALEMSGSCDLGEVAGSLVALAGRTFPAAEFVVEMPECLLVAVPERVLVTVLYELLDNALEATERAGKILVSAHAADSDIVIDVFDDGTGVDPTVTRTAQVFRPGFSTRGEDRGTGLHLARRLTDAVRGELEVADRSHGHPVYTGAHFTLIVPASS